EGTPAERTSEYILRAAPDAIQTFTYTRLINSKTAVEDQPRCDFVNTRPLPAAVENQIIANFNAHFHEFDVILVSDQAETMAGGVGADLLRDLVAGVAGRHPEEILVGDLRPPLALFFQRLGEAHKERAAPAPPAAVPPDRFRPP